MSTLVLIRHGKTAGNLQKRYIGRTDGPLCPEGKKEMIQKRTLYPAVQLVYSSPLLRCRQTAEILYPQVPLRIAEDLRETDFGAFEGKNYQELKHHPAYQAFLDSGGQTAFPGGEEPAAFKARCRREFSRIVREGMEAQKVAVVCHGGTVMAILEAFCLPKRDFYSYQVANGCGFVLRSIGDGLFEIETEIG